MSDSREVVPDLTWLVIALICMCCVLLIDKAVISLSNKEKEDFKKELIQPYSKDTVYVRDTVSIKSNK